MMRRVLVRLGVGAAGVVTFLLLGQRLASEVVVYAAAVSAWGFVILYHAWSRGAWMRDPVGRHVMSFVAVDAFVFTELAVGIAYPWILLITWFTWVYIMSVAGIPWTIIERILIMVGLYRSPGTGNPALLPENAPVPAIMPHGENPR